jgi:hypothetical protein
MTNKTRDKPIDVRRELRESKRIRRKLKMPTLRWKVFQLPIATIYLA